MCCIYEGGMLEVVLKLPPLVASACSFACPQEVEVGVEDGEGSPVQLTILRDLKEQEVTVRMDGDNE